MGIGIFGERHVRFRLLQSLDIGAARHDRDVIISDAVKQTDRLAGRAGVVMVGDVARRIEPDMRGELHRAGRIQFPESLGARIDRGDRALGKAHDGNAGWIDPRMLGKQPQRPIGVDHHGERVELRLIARGADDAAAGEAIENERRDADLVELARPAVCGDRQAA